MTTERDLIERIHLAIMISEGTDSNASPSDESVDWKHMTTGDAPFNEDDPLLSTYEFMNVKTGEIKTTVAYNMDEAERRIASEG